MPGKVARAAFSQPVFAAQQNGTIVVKENQAHEIGRIPRANMCLRISVAFRMSWPHGSSQLSMNVTDPLQ
jgi:hypothetical protein